jgi:hypothetical protein
MQLRATLYGPLFLLFALLLPSHQSFAADNPCADENGYCAFAGTMLVQYGAEGSYFSRTMSGGTMCSNDIFGDPAPGVFKSCKISFAPDPSSVAPSGSFCASENAYCSFQGEGIVQYGGAGLFVSKLISNGTSCDNATFGDPAPGNGKSCYFTSLATGNVQPSGSYCAEENSYCAFSGSGVVMYGANGYYNSKVVDGGTNCSNEVFGDPAPGSPKACFYLPTQTPPTDTTAKTTAGVPLPEGWGLKQADHFGYNGNVASYESLHSKYYEGQFYNRVGSAGLVQIPNTRINHEQQDYVHFEQAVAFANDHITIQAHGQPDGQITSAEMVSIYTARSFCVESKYTTAGNSQSWSAFWNITSEAAADTSELDVEHPNNSYLGVNDVSFHSHPESTNFQVVDNRFDTGSMNWHEQSFDSSREPHTYTICYDDSRARASRYIDGHQIFEADFKWNSTIGGTGYGPDATTILNLAVGGDWLHDVADPVHFQADMDIYSVEYYGP